MAHRIVTYRLAEEWATHCQAFKVLVLDVQALAAQGKVLEAYRLLQERLTEKDKCAIRSARPQGAPFAVEILATSGPGVEPLKAQQIGASDALARSRASDAPTPAGASFRRVGQRRGRLVFVVVSNRGSWPFGSFKVDVAIVQRVAVSEQVFVRTSAGGGASNV